MPPVTAVPRAPGVLSAAVLRPDDALLARFPNLYGATAGVRAAALAAALSTSTALSDSAGGERPIPSSRLVVRLEPEPLIALVGSFDAGDAALVDALGWQVQDSLARLRPRSYAQVELACGVLADRLRERLGAEVLARSRLVGVPRGGLVVAGLLAYCLDLPAQQVGEGPLDPGALLLVVDDCVLSGARTRRWLRANPGPQVVLAHLHSHPDLRRAVERDPRVLACVAAEDLHDHAPERQGEGYDDWRRRWALRSPDDYWTGHPDHVCYPWNEPDTVVWNAATQQAEPGWHVLPPSWCLKNRVAQAADVSICAPSLQLPPGVLWVELGSSVVVVDADLGTTTELQGTAADFWRALLSHADIARAVTSLLGVYSVDLVRLTADVRDFAATLRSRGLLAPEPLASADAGTA